MTSYYIQTNVICLLLLIVVYRIISNKKTAFSSRRYAFGNLVKMTMVLCLSDIFAWTCNGKSFPGAHIVVEVSNMLYYLALSWICFAWLVYVNVRVCTPEEYTKKRMAISSVPLLLMTLIILINPFTQLLFSVDENNVYARGDLIIIHWIVTWGYLIVSLVKSTTRIHRAKSRYEKTGMFSMQWFIVLPAIAAIVQMIFYGVTAMQTGITLSIIMITFGTLSEQISRDTLTGLNNRNALENFVREKLEKAPRHFTVLMCDIDKFKSINDNYGHTFGDIALQNTSRILKKACANCVDIPLFLCRYGGDEFLICGTETGKGAIANLRSEIAAALKDFNDTHDSQIPISISIGSSDGMCADDNEFEELLGRADTEMYKNKKEKAASSLAEFD